MHILSSTSLCTKSRRSTTPRTTAPVTATAATPTTPPRPHRPTTTAAGKRPWWLWIRMTRRTRPASRWRWHRCRSRRPRARRRRHSAAGNARAWRCSPMMWVYSCCEYHKSGLEEMQNFPGICSIQKCDLFVCIIHFQTYLYEKDQNTYSKF